MGVLDDAIREHLELKRRHGATDDEIAQQEAEALGPARRIPLEPEPAGADDAQGAVAPEPEAPSEAETDLGELEPPSPADAAGVTDAEPLAALREPEAEAPAPVDEVPVQEPDVEEGPEVEEGPAEEPPVEDDPLAPPREPEPASAVDEGAAGEPAEADDDLLEETPDFLQDTPEHDRLWFEQKPPRDFDLD